MPRHSPVLGLFVVCRMREIRDGRKLREMEEQTGVPSSLLSQIERGERLPKPGDIAGLERGYGSQDSWYRVNLRESV